MEYSITHIKLLNLFNEQEKELFKTFSNYQGDLIEISATDSFVEGFGLGMGVAIEVMEK